MMQEEMVRKVKGNNSHESQCESGFQRFPCLAKVLVEGDEREREKKTQLFLKYIRLVQKKVQILKSKVNVHVITYCPVSLNYGRVNLISV